MADARNQRSSPHRRPTSPPPGWRVEGDAESAGRKPEEQPPRRRRLRPPGGVWFWWILVILLAVNWFLAPVLYPSGPERTTVSYSFFIKQFDAKNLKEITTSGTEGNTIKGSFKQKATYAPDGGSGKQVLNFKTQRPGPPPDGVSYSAVTASGVTVNAKSADQARSLVETLLIGFGPTILLVALFIFIMRRAAAGAGGGLMGFGRSRAKRYEASAQRTTFADVAGIEDAKQELTEIVDFLKTPDRYLRLGGAIPRGVLLYGPPGTGKTLLARAVAGEAGVPFFSLSASEFVEMLVGVGASRVRDLFNQAKAAAPAIIFIDELDAIGRSRGASSLGGNEEREQTLNQILTEMDGFSGSEGVIVIGATNRPEVLDPALLRPGRFDRRVAVNPPDQVGRLEILEVHTRHMPLDPGLDLAAIASATAGMVGADLKNLANEAALTAARRGHDRVQFSDFTDALEKVILGTERRIMLSQEDRERTAYHESGHALLGMLEPGADPVRKVSIVPRGRALGVTFQSPATDRYGYDAQYLRGRIVGALGGRAAEELIYGNYTTGAESDLEQVTRIARQMVGRWGMSDAIGPVSVLPGPQDEPLLLPGTGGGVSPATQELIDREVRRIIEECYDVALVKLRANRDKLDALAHALLERETLDEIDAYAAAGIPRGPEVPAPVGGP
jgi:cell division protease FtsH